MTRLVVRRQAEHDIVDAHDWYAEVAPEQALHFLDEIDGVFQQVTERPRLFRVAHDQVRLAPLRRFPYIVWYVYSDDEDTARVLAVTHDRQNPDMVRARLGG